MRGIREDVAYRLPEKGYDLAGDEAWSMAGALMEEYLSNRFRSLMEIYEYIGKTGKKLAEDIMDDVPRDGKVFKQGLLL